MGYQKEIDATGIFDRQKAIPSRNCSARQFTCRQQEREASRRRATALATERSRATPRGWLLQRAEKKVDYSTQC